MIWTDDAKAVLLGCRNEAPPTEGVSLREFVRERVE